MFSGAFRDNLKKEFTQFDLTPPFVSGTTEYTAQVGAAMVPVALVPTTDGSDVSIRIAGEGMGPFSDEYGRAAFATPASGEPGGPWYLRCGPNRLTVTLTAPNGASRVYRLTVTARDCPTGELPRNVVLTPGDRKVTLTWDHPTDTLPPAPIATGTSYAIAGRMRPTGCATAYR